MLRVARYMVIILVMLFFKEAAQAQHFDIIANRKRVILPFTLARNLIIIKVSINNRGPYNFILDTGVGLMLITDHKLIDSLNIVNKRTVKIAGLGEHDDYEAVVAPMLKVNVGEKLISKNLSAAILKQDFFGLSAYAGMPVHGLIGYELFSQLAIKINFADSSLVVTPSGKMRIFRKAEKIPITIEGNKPYTQTTVISANGQTKTSKLLVDLGAGHPLLLERSEQLPDMCIPANLGVGLNGLIEGYLGRVNYVSIGKHNIGNAITSFPVDDPSYKTSVPRDGSIGMGILKRFDIIFDYQNGTMYLKPNLHYKEAFEHDMSGLSYHAAGKNFDRLIIEKVDAGSAAEEIGLQANDEILSVNFKPVNKMNLQQIDELMQSKHGRTLLLEVSRDKFVDRVLLTLKRRI